mgnify:CR=1 FL=1
MYADLNDFRADLDKRRLLTRIGEPVSPDLETAAVTARACQMPGGGPALRRGQRAGTLRVCGLCCDSARRVMLSKRSAHSAANSLATHGAPQYSAGCSM